MCKELEEGVLDCCQESLENLEPEAEVFLGEVSSAQAKVLTWERLVAEARTGASRSSGNHKRSVARTNKSPEAIQG